MEGLFRNVAVLLQYYSYEEKGNKKWSEKHFERFGYIFQPFSTEK